MGRMGASDPPASFDSSACAPVSHERGAPISAEAPSSQGTLREPTDSERVLVCVGPAPSSRHLIQAAARLAAGLRCPWVAVHVESPSLVSLTEEERERIRVHLRVAETLGATATRLSGERIAETLLAYARRNGVTHLVLGKPTRARLRDRLRGSLLEEVARGSGDLELHVLSGGAALEKTPPPRPEVSATRLRGYLITGSIVLVTVLLAALLRAAFHLPDPEMLFLLAVILSSVWFGRGPALFAAALGVACFDFFFVPPRFTFTVSDQRYVLTFATMFGVGYIMSELAGRLRRQEREALFREERTSVLYALTRELSSSQQVSKLAEVAVNHAHDVFDARAVLLLRTQSAEPALAASAPAGTCLDKKQQAVANWVLRHGVLAGLGTESLPGTDVVCSPLRGGQETLGVLALCPRDGAALQAEQQAFLDVFCRQVAVAVGRATLAEQARVTALRVKTEEMRSSLLSSVSHDLRTPLASITGAGTALRDDPRLEPATRHELVVSICEQAERLERLVANLLDMTRLQSGPLALKRDWLPLEELVGSALNRLETRLGEREIAIHVPSSFPWLFVDPVLFEQLFVNLLENAAKYTPAGSRLELSAHLEGTLLVMELKDHGPGLPPGEEELVFEKFHRGPHVGVAGAGLGLAICRGIAEAHGGTLTARNREEGGAVFRVCLPMPQDPPSITALESHD